MRLYIIRHADPDYPNRTITPAGHREAAALAQRMARLRPDRIYSSPLERARHTAQYTADVLGLPCEVEDWTAELSDCRLDLAPWGSFCMWDLPGEIIRARQPLPTQDNWHQMLHLSNPRFRDRYEALRVKSDEFLARHGFAREGGAYRILRHSREKIAVFCHGGFGLCWLAHLLEIPLPMVFAGFTLLPSSVTTILFDERSMEFAVPRCIGLGDISHLYAANLPPSASGIKANAD